MKQEKTGGLGIVSIMTLYLVSMGVTMLTPAMATFAEHFPGRDISWIMTLPTLFTVIGTAISGSIMGKRLSYRTIAAGAAIISLIGGLAPAFVDSYAFLLVCRGIMGFGLGLMAPLGNALILGMFGGQKQASLLGYGTLFMNGGGIILQLIGGALATVNWRVTFWGHAFLVVALIMAFFLPEPEKKTGEMGRPEEREKMSRVVWLIGLLIFLYNMMAFPIMFNMSVLFAQREVGGAAAAATSLSLYTVAGVISGLVFGTIFRFAKRCIISIGLFCCGCGYAIVYVGNTALLITVGLMIVGFGFSQMFTAYMSWSGMVTPVTTVAAASAIILAAMNLGGFVSSFWLKLLEGIFGESLYSAMLICIIFCLALGLVFLFVSPFRVSKAEEKK